MKFVKVILFLLITASSYGQYQSISVPTYWHGASGFDNVFIGNDTIVQTDKTKRWIAIKNAVMYFHDGTKWTAISSGGSGGSFTLPQADSNTLGGIKYNTDFALDANNRLGIAPGKKALWNTIANLPIFYATGDSTRRMMHDTAVAHDYVIGDNLTLTGRRLDVVLPPTATDSYTSSIWYNLLDKPAVWDAKTDYSEFLDSVNSLRAIRRDSVFFDRRYFAGNSTSSSPITLVNVPDYSTTESGLIKPGYVTWSGTGYTYDVTPAIYRVNGLYYTSVAGSVTLDAADGALNRIDAVVVDTFGVVSKITGVAASNPVAPIPNPSSQVLLTNITVTLGSSAPSTLNTIVYNEEGNGEYTGSSSGVTSNTANTTFPFSGAKSDNIGAWTSGSTITFTNGTTASATSYTYLKFFIRLKGIVQNATSISVIFYNGTTPVSKLVSIVNYGINKSLVGSYQNVSVPFSVFGFTSNQFNKIQFRFGGPDGPGCYLDFIQLQNSAVTETGSNALTDVFLKSDSLFKTVGGNSLFVGKVGGSGSSTDTTFLRRDINANTTAIATNTSNITTNTNSIASNTTAIGTKLSIADTSAFARKTNTISINGNTQTLGSNPSFTVSGGTATDTTSLSNRINLKADKTNTVTINGNSQQLGGNPSFTVSGGGSSADTSTNYVSNSGSNTNNGYTSSTPKQTIAASQSVINSKATATGSASLLLEAGGVYPEEFKPSANNISVSSYNVNDVSVGFKDKGMWPIMSGADVFNSGWTLAGGFSNTYTRSVTTTTTDEFSNLGQYSYLNVIAIDTALEKVRPFSARYYLLPVTSTALVESTPGSYYTGTSTVSPTTVYIHLPNNSNPNSNATYRIEVSTRKIAIDAFNGPTSYKVNASYVIERDYMAGYGGFSSGSNSKYDHVIMRNGGGHAAVIAGGTVGNSLVLGGAKGIVSGAIDFYSLAGIGGHNKVFNTMFLNIGAALGTHTSGGINHGTLEINNVFAWPDSTDSQNFVFANNTDTLLLNGVYTDHQYIILSNVGVAPNTTVKNSVFVNGTQFGNAPNNFIIDNTLFKAYSLGASSASNPSGPSLNANTRLKITNSIIHLKTYAATAQTQSFISNTAATSSQRVYSKNNIFIMDAAGGSAGGALTDNSGTVRDTFDYNIYIRVKGALGFGTTVQGNNLTFSQWQTNSGQDVHSLYIDLTNEGNGLKAVFVDPDNGNYNLVQGGWGDSIRARQAGMLTPPAYFFSKPTQEQAVQMVMNDKIPTIQSLFNISSTSNPLTAAIAGGANTQVLYNQNGGQAGSSNFTVIPNGTSSGATLKGINFTPTLTLGAGDTSVGIYIRPTYNVGAFTTAKTLDILTSKNIQVNGIAVGTGGGNVTSNTVFGFNSLNSNVTGARNSAIGASSLLANTASDNTAMGYQSMLNNTTGNGNTAIGTSSLSLNVTGSNNAAFGFNALQKNTSSENTGIGNGALQNNTSGTGNIGVGFNAAIGNTTGARNVGIGRSALNNTTTNSDNTAVGYFGIWQATGGTNTALGSNSGYGITSGTGNITLGYTAGKYATTQSNQIILNSLDRTTYAGDTTNSPVYIMQNTTPGLQRIRLNGVIYVPFGTVLTSQTEPATPAVGTVVEWWDGTNKKWKKSDGTTGIIY